MTEQTTASRSETQTGGKNRTPRSEEFEDDEPGITRVHEINIVTDGEASDWEKLLPYLKAASTRRIYNILILGGGDGAKAVYDAYTKAAEENQKADPKGRRHINVALFDEVTDPLEVAQDAIAMTVGEQAA